MRGIFFLFFTIILLITVSAAGCAENTPDDAGNPSWTWIFYLAGDNSLSSALQTDFEELYAVPWAQTIIVLRDSTQGVSLYKIKDGQTNRLYAPELNISAKTTVFDSGSPENLRAFLHWACSNWPADRMALTVGGHGDGWFPAVRRAIASDDGSGTRIGTDRFIDALQGFRFDLIVLDLCLTGTVETAYSLTDATGQLVASPELIPEYGLNYTGVLSSLQQNPVTDGAALARRIVDLHPGSTMTAIDTAALKRIIDNGAVPDMTAALSDPGLRSNISASVTRYTVDGFAVYADLVDLAGRCNLFQLRDDLLAALHTTHSNKRVSIYWPRYAGQLDSRYATNLPFCTATGWGDWIKKSLNPTNAEADETANNRWDTAGNVSVSTNLQRMFADSFDEDWAGITLPAGGQITATVSPAISGVRLELYRDGKTGISLCAVNSSTTQLQTNLSAGVYRLCVRRDTADDTPTAYQLQLSLPGL